MRLNKNKIILYSLILLTSGVISLANYNLDRLYAKGSLDHINEDDLDMEHLTSTNIKTTEDEYKNILNNYSYDCSLHEDAYDISVQITDDLFIDSEENKENITNCYDEIKAYLDGAILITHVAGEFIETTLVNDKEKISIKDIKEDIKNNSLNEREYLRYLEETILDILGNNERGEKNLRYFEDSTYSKVLDILNKINNNENKYINFKAFGKSAIDSNEKDLVIISINFESKNETLVLKLDSTNKIYEIDII